MSVAEAAPGNIVRFFLLVHDQAEGVTRISEFDDPDQAERAYDRAEPDVPDAPSGPNHDIVLVGSDSLATVKRTHASYFTGQHLVRT